MPADERGAVGSRGRGMEAKKQEEVLETGLASCPPYWSDDNQAARSSLLQQGQMARRPPPIAARVMIHHSSYFPVSSTEKVRKNGNTVSGSL